jgi:P22 coat protein - gene protein 5
MANTVLTPSIIAAESLLLLENNLVMANQVYRDYEGDFMKNYNGYKPGDTISIRRPTDFVVRSGAVAAIQDVVEGSITIVVNQQQGVDFKFSSADLTLRVEDFSERFLQPAMIQLANKIDLDVMALYKQVFNWVGTPGQNVDSFADFAKAPERLDNNSAPEDKRSAVLSVTDYWAMAGSQTALFPVRISEEAYRRGSVGEVGGVDTYQSQNVLTHVVGTKAGSGVAAAGQDVLYDNVKNSVPYGQTLNTTGWTASSAILKAGDILTIGTLGTNGLQAVNSVTKATLPYLKQFVVTADVSADGSGNAAISISPPIISATTGNSAAQRTVHAAMSGSSAITVLGTASTGYLQNLVFHKNAFALAVVPMERPAGAVDVARKSYRGLSCRVVPYYDGTNDVSNYRLDVLYGVRTLDGRLATRLSGT